VYLLLKSPPTEDGVINGWGPEYPERIFSLAHISITSYVFDVLTLFLYLISAHLVTFTVIFYFFSNSVQLRKVTGMNRA